MILSTITWILYFYFLHVSMLHESSKIFPAKFVQKAQKKESNISAHPRRLHPQILHLFLLLQSTKTYMTNYCPNTHLRAKSKCVVNKGTRGTVWYDPLLPSSWDTDIALSLGGLISTNGLPSQTRKQVGFRAHSSSETEACFIRPANSLPLRSDFISRTLT